MVPGSLFGGRGTAVLRVTLDRVRDLAHGVVNQVAHELGDRLACGVTARTEPGEALKASADNAHTQAYRALKSHVTGQTSTKDDDGNDVTVNVIPYADAVDV